MLLATAQTQFFLLSLHHIISIQSLVIFCLDGVLNTLVNDLRAGFDLSTGTLKEIPKTISRINHVEDYMTFKVYVGHISAMQLIKLL